MLTATNLSVLYPWCAVCNVCDVCNVYNVYNVCNVCTRQVVKRITGFRKKKTNFLSKLTTHLHNVDAGYHWPAELDFERVENKRIELVMSSRAVQTLEVGAPTSVYTSTFSASIVSRFTTSSMAEIAS
jgi:hypothetical protein